MMMRGNMKGGLKIGAVIVLSSFIQACGQVDNYILGKENLPKPKQLTEIKPKVAMQNQWSAALAKKSKNSAYLKLKPEVVDNKIYLASNNGTVQAVSRDTGSTIWSANVGKQIVSGPAVANGAVIVGTNAATIVMLDQSNGKKLWTAHLSEDTLSKASILKDRVIVKTIDGNLYAFATKDGSQLWMFEHGSPNLILKASSSPVVVGNLALVGFSDGKLDAVDIDDGRLVWQRSIAYATGSSDVEKLIDIDADPIVRNNVVYVGSYQGYIGGISLETGQFVWSKAGSVYKNMAMDHNGLYVVDAKDVLWAFDDASGRVKWKQEALKHHGLTDPVLMGNKLIVADKSGYLHAISLKNGELIGRTQLGAGINISPVVAGNTAYTVGNNGVVSATKVS